MSITVRVCTLCGRECSIKEFKTHQCDFSCVSVEDNDVFKEKKENHLVSRDHLKRIQRVKAKCSRGGSKSGFEWELFSRSSHSKPRERTTSRSFIETCGLNESRQSNLKTKKQTQDSVNKIVNIQRLSPYELQQFKNMTMEDIEKDFIRYLEKGKLPSQPNFKVGDIVFYKQSDGTQTRAKIYSWNTNVPIGEEPEISVELENGVRETVLERLSPF
jgi:hypothetical protein